MTKKQHWASHGNGKVSSKDFGAYGKGIVIEDDVLIFHPESIFLGDNIYIGHGTILHGYHKNKMNIESGTWIGPFCYLHSAGGIYIGKDVGIGPGVKMITSQHLIDRGNKAIIKNDVSKKEIIIQNGSDIGVGAIVLPGVTINEGAQIGAGAVVAEDIPQFGIAVGVPAVTIRHRKGHLV
ncbi:MAG: hypothetical protein US54_C0002G0007 [Candidatus Roizmanbacteria bacterium GW2011_GWA2_37_7]|uniref:Transferase hexapeptide repeat containing protein n=1 Tax=Candidatus Roizmanbacteria bacterium GW2011_GWA2_37_7 TaxID=1618481 RepID=A0A0G0JPJ0_9BACT|nr:MAG: hypothetical protein US54_C0002G0007 [Candidatus Roizmanbacteria bacterium GW2011_GWA2_37_7]